MEGTERGWSRPAEPAPRWRSLFGRGRLRQAEEPEVVDEWIASIRSVREGAEEFPPGPPANGTSPQSGVGQPSEADYLPPPPHRGQPASDSTPAGADYQQPQPWMGHGEPAVDTPPTAEPWVRPPSRDAMLEPGFAADPPNGESRYAALEPGYAPPPAAPRTGGADRAHRTRGQPPQWAEPTGPPAWSEPTGPPAWAESTGPPAWAEPDVSAQPWADTAGSRWSELEVPARPWDGQAAPGQWAERDVRRPWAEPDAPHARGAPDMPRPWAEPDVPRPWAEPDVPRPWAEPDAPHARGVPDALARPWAVPETPALPSGASPSDAHSAAELAEAAQPWSARDLPGRARAQPEGLPRPRVEPDEPARPWGASAAVPAAPAQPAVGRARAGVAHVIPAPRTPGERLPVPQRGDVPRSQPPGQRAGLMRSELPAGASDAEVERAIEVLQRKLTKPRVIAFANPKGGVHKTTATVLAAATVGSVRGRGVLAWDDNELRGTLGLRAGSARHARTIRHLVSDLASIEASYGTQLDGRLDEYLRHASDSSYDVLAGEESPRFAQRLDRHTVQRVIELLRRTREVICVDTGNNVESVNWQTVMQTADQLVVTTVPREDAAFTADWMLDLLHEEGMGELADKAVTLLSCATPDPSPLLDDLAAHFATRTRVVKIVPYDPALETGSSIEYGQLQHETRQAWLQACAGMLEPFTG